MAHTQKMFIKINLINKGLFSFVNLFSTKSNTKNVLSPMWITGLTDAEGKFIVSIYKRSDTNKWQIKPSFELWLNSKDINTLQELKNFFGVGIINTRKDKNVTSFTVTKNSDLVNIIIPHFSNFPLQTQKLIDFKL